jgi:N-acetylglutamate synthase-like GNAT family acetyltransferase
MKSARNTVVIEPANAGDAAAIAALLRAEELPSDDFAAHLARFVVARDEQGAAIGAIGAEVYGADALLRSFVVAPAHRGAGLGGRLLDALEHAAGGWGVERWWLLTMTAEEFFKGRGFRSLPREAAPAAIAATGEFQGLCPSVAVCLSRERKPS